MKKKTIMTITIILVLGLASFYYLDLRGSIAGYENAIDETETNIVQLEDQITKMIKKKDNIDKGVSTIKESTVENALYPKKSMYKNGVKGLLYTERLNEDESILRFIYESSKKEKELYRIKKPWHLINYYINGDRVFFATEKREFLKDSGDIRSTIRLFSGYIRKGKFEIIDEIETLYPDLFKFIEITPPLTSFDAMIVRGEIGNDENLYTYKNYDLENPIVDMGEKNITDIKYLDIKEGWYDTPHIIYNQGNSAKIKIHSVPRKLAKRTYLYSFGHEDKLYYLTQDQSGDKLQVNSSNIYDLYRGTYYQDDKLLSAFHKFAYKSRLKYPSYKFENSIAFGDFNGDGKKDLASLGYMSETMSSYVWVGTLTENGEYQKIFELPLHQGYHLQLKKNQQLNGHDSFIVSYGNSPHGIFYTGEIAFGYSDGLIKPLTLEINEESMRRGLLNKWEIDLRASNIDNDSYNFFVYHYEEKLVIDGKMEDRWRSVRPVRLGNAKTDITHGEKNWSGIKDLSSQVRTMVGRDKIFIFGEINDDQIVFDESDSLKQDHIELWLSFSDDNLHQLGIFNNQVYDYYPEIRENDSIESRLVKSDTGYNVEVAIPIEEYAEWSLSSYDEIGFTFVISDTDSAVNRAQDTLITSSDLKWGKSDTLGKIIMRFRPYNVEEFDEIEDDYYGEDSKSE